MALKFHLLSPDASHRYDPPWWDLLRKLPGLTEAQNQADVVVILVTRLDNFVFNPALNQLDKPYVLVCGSEYFWDWRQDKTHVWGKNTHEFSWFNQNVQWALFESWVAEHPPLLTFKRELLAEDVSPTMVPIEYACWAGYVAKQTRAEFEARSLQVLFQWGRSHESRVRLHANIFRQSSYLGYEVLSEWRHLDAYFKENPAAQKVWATIYVPHFAREDMKVVDHWGGRAKICVSMSGCGVKCFRHSEVCHNSIMALPKDNLAWSVPWEHGVNAIRLDTLPGGASIIHTQENVEVENLRVALDRPDLYEIYCAGVETADKLRPHRYLPEYFVPNVEKLL